MDNPETQAIMSTRHKVNEETQHRNLVNVRENRMGNKEWTIHKYGQKFVHKTQDNPHPLPPKKNKNK